MKKKATILLLIFIGIVLIFLKRNESSGQDFLSIYLDGSEVETIPIKNSALFEKTVCDDDVNVHWDNKRWGIVVGNLNNKVKCNLYFKTLDNKVSEIISEVSSEDNCPTMNDDGTVNVTEYEADNGYLCQMNNGTAKSYYFRGNNVNNYVKFANFYWRIIRINDDNSVRVIYDGTEGHSNGEASTDRQIGTSTYNEKNNDNMYVGYMYGDANGLVESEIADTTLKASGTIYVASKYNYDESTGLFSLTNPVAVSFNALLGTSQIDKYKGYYTLNLSSSKGTSSKAYKIIGSSTELFTTKISVSTVSYGSTSIDSATANTNDSAVKSYLDSWYENNIKNTDYENYVVKRIFCSDRSINENKPTNFLNNGFGTGPTAYRWYYENNDGFATVSKTLSCSNFNDNYSTTDAILGNKSLTYPIGLISTDEVILAGGWSKDNKKYYLYTGQNYWTMTPSAFKEATAIVNQVSSTGSANSSSIVSKSAGVKPVLDLKSTTLLQGDGTIGNPYRLLSE